MKQQEHQFGPIPISLISSSLLLLEGREMIVMTLKKNLSSLRSTKLLLLFLLLLVLKSLLREMIDF